MLQPGFETTDPITGTRSVLIEGVEETAGRGWTIEVHCPEGAPPSILEHVHQTWTETFEIVDGEATYTLGGKDQVLKAGDRVEMPVGVKHVHPWNTGSGTMVYRQMNDFGNEQPEAVDDVLGVFATINGLAREGKVNKKGLPKNPLQFAATLRTLVRYEGYDAAVPIVVQRIMSATMGRVAEAMGYRGADPKYMR